MKTHGDTGWDSFPSYLDILVPRVLHCFKEWHLTITFFIVGQDAVFDKNREALAAIAAAGHEIGNHSFHHQPWLHLYTEQQIEDELIREALRVSGLKTKRAAVEAGLRALIRLNKRRKILDLAGKVQWEGNLDESREGRFPP